MPREFVQIQTTIDDPDRAQAMIRGAVDERLAACGQLLGPLKSTYWWNGEIESAEEWLCLFKTRVDLADELKEWILERHPYEVPEVVVVEIADASKTYGEWIRDETAE